MPPRKKSKKDKKAQLCRVCLSAETETWINFDVISPWSHMISYCFGITVCDDSISRVLCKECSVKVKEFADFKDLALNSEHWWNTFLDTETKTEQNEKDSNNDIVEIKKEEDDETFQDVDNLEYGADDNVSLKDLSQEIKDNKKDKDNEEEKLDTSDIKEESPEEKQSKGLSEKQFIKKYFRVFKNKGSKHEHTSYECLQCLRIIKRRSGLAKHVKECYESEVFVIKSKEYKPHRAPDTYDCGICAFTNKDENTTVKHFKDKHCLANDLSCKMCNFTGRDMADVVSHRYTHIPDDVKFRGKFRCPTCDKIRLNELSLQFHYRQVHLNKKAGGWCSVCNKTFTGYIYFRNHMRLHKTARFICDLCGARFLFRNLIVAHIQEHMNIRNYVCDTCGKAFKRANALSGHIRACHTVHKSVTCDHCGKHFKNQHSLKLHMKLVRKGNNYICDICCKGHAQLSLLKKHMFWHTGERPFSCDTCGGKFKSKGNLNLHMRKHMGIFPFKCGSCEKQFMTSTQLKAHSSVHTGIRRVKCLVCEKTFHEKRQMLAHCRAKHDSLMFKNENESASLLPSTSLVAGGFATPMVSDGSLIPPPPV